MYELSLLIVLCGIYSFTSNGKGTVNYGRPTWSKL
jgi:hypothetical protein